MSKQKSTSYFKVIKLKDLIRNHNAGIYKKSELYGTGSNIVGVSDLYGHNSIHGQMFRQVPLSKNELKTYSLQEGDLIYGESSLVINGIAKSLYVTQKGMGTAFAWHTRRYSVNKSSVNPCYLYYSLEGEDARKQIMSVATQTALTGITTKDYFNTEINLPPLPTQHRIARILSTADAVIEKTQAAITKYKAIKQGMLHDLFTRGIDMKTGKLRPTYENAPELYKESKLCWIPKEWKVDSLGEVISVSSGCGLTQNNIKPGIHPVYGGNGINGYHSEYLFIEKRLIIGRVGEYCGNALITKPFSWVTDNALVVTNIKKTFSLFFWLFYLNYLDLNSIAFAAAQPVITGGIINKVDIVKIESGAVVPIPTYPVLP